MCAVQVGVGLEECAVLGLEIFQLLFEVLDMFLLALAEGSLRGAVLGTAPLESVRAGSSRLEGNEKRLTMRMLETVSLSWAVVDRLLLRSSCWGAVRSMNSIELTMAG